MLKVDPGCDFLGLIVTKEMENHKTFIRCGCTEIQKDQAVVEHFNCMLREHLFSHQYGNAPACGPAVDCVGQKANHHCCRS